MPTKSMRDEYSKIESSLSGLIEDLSKHKPLEQNYVITFYKDFESLINQSMNFGPLGFLLIIKAVEHVISQLSNYKFDDTETQLQVQTLIETLHGLLLTCCKITLKMIENPLGWPAFSLPISNPDLIIKLQNAFTDHLSLISGSTIMRLQKIKKIDIIAQTIFDHLIHDSSEATIFPLDAFNLR